MSDENRDRGPVVPPSEPAKLPGPEPLTGNHVVLERLVEKHFADLWKTVGAHHDTWYWWPDEPCKTEEEFYEYLRNFLKFSDDLAIYSVIFLSGPNKGTAAGLGMALSEERESNRIAEIGLFLGPMLQGSRAGTEPPYLLSKLMFDLNHRRLQWKTNSLNRPSRNAAERYGFLHEGTLRQAQINKGHNRDTAIYGMIDSEWPLCEKAFEVWLEDGNFDEQGRQKKKLQEIRESLK